MFYLQACIILFRIKFLHIMWCYAEIIVRKTLGLTKFPGLIMAVMDRSNLIETFIFNESQKTLSL